jgi:hypothetical protein
MCGFISLRKAAGNKINSKSKISITMVKEVFIGLK